VQFNRDDGWEEKAQHIPIHENPTGPTPTLSIQMNTSPLVHLHPVQMEHLCHASASKGRETSSETGFTSFYQIGLLTFISSVLVSSTFPLKIL